MKPFYLGFKLSVEGWIPFYSMKWLTKVFLKEKQSNSGERTLACLENNNNKMEDQLEYLCGQIWRRGRGKNLQN